MTSSTTPAVDGTEDRDTDPAATPEQAHDAIVSGKADPGAAPPGEDESLLKGLGRSIGNIVLGSLPDPGPRDGVAGGKSASDSDGT